MCFGKSAIYYKFPANGLFAMIDSFLFAGEMNVASDAMTWIL